MKSEIFSDFILVGGTALALHIGHRNSIDIDMFGNAPIDADAFIEELSKFGNVEKIQQTKNVLILMINNIKVDFVNYKYGLLQEYTVIDDVRLASKKDIAAMKLNAISGRGSKKDFIDLYFLLSEFTLKEMFGFYNEKYADGTSFLVVKSLTYFEDADEQQSPKMFAELDWDTVKWKIIEEFNKL